MQSRSSSDTEMDRRIPQPISALSQPVQPEERHPPQSAHVPSYHERHTHHHTQQQQGHRLQHYHRSQPGPVPFGIYRSQQQDLSRPVLTASSLPRQLATSSPMPTAAPARFVVKEETTTVKVPMLRPRPGLLKVLHLSGGIGETFTMGEVINHVKEYIRERSLYDQQDPRIVHCAGDLLSLALGVDTFTVNDAIGLFKKNCTMEPDSCIRIRRHLVTRSVTPQQQSTTRSVANSNSGPSGRNSTTVVSSHPHPATTIKEISIDFSPSTEASRQQPMELEINTSIQSLLQTDPSPSLSSSSALTPTLMSSTLPSSSSSALTPTLMSSTLPSSLSSQPSLSSSSSSSAVIKFKAAQSFVTVTDSDHEKSSGEQAAPSGDSSSDEGKSDIFRDQHSRKGLGKSNGQQRTRTTSINVTYDEPDGATEPWTCEVIMETSSGEMSKPENDTLVVEFDSDAFSVEYEVESDPETDTPGGTKSAADQTCAESDESSSISGAAILLVCKESDVEYLADYSDSDNGSNSEFSDADQWECEHCLKKNPPFQRNCGGCWSVRPDWLPSNSKGNEGKTRAATELSGSDKLLPEIEELQLQNQENLKEDLKSSSQEQISDIISQNNPTSQTDKNTNCGSKRRRCSSSLSTSDSQDCKKKRRFETLQDNVAASLSEEPKRSDKKSAGDSVTSRDESCIVCLTRRKTACIIHGKTGHQVCCYRCARRLKEQRKSCPICRRPIQKVIRNFFA